jgi:hypothetical protein
VAIGFIEGWKGLINDWQYAGLPQGQLRHAHIANHPEEAALLGQTVDLQEHHPYAEIACFATYVICDKEGASEEELEEQLLLDKFGHCSIAREELPEGSGNHLEKGGGPPEGGGSETSSKERQRARGKGKAEVENTWCSGRVAFAGGPQV